MSTNQFIEMDDKDLTAVSKDFFVDGLMLSANVYLKIKPGRYILIGKRNTVSNISTYHAVGKQETQIYVLNVELPGVTSSNFAFTEKIVAAEKIATSVKTRYVNTLTDSVLGDIEKFGVGTSVEHLKRIGHFIQELTANIEGLDDLLASLSTLPNEIARHAMSSAVISLLICEEMGMTLKAALEKVALGALLHDVGLREIPQEILTKPRRAWSESDLQHYESHPLRGVEILRDVPQISNDILSIVNEHHENALGTGFPRRIRDIKMTPLARIVALADYVADLMYTSETGAPAKNLDEVIEYIENVLGQPFNKPAFLSLRKLANKQNLINKTTKA